MSASAALASIGRSTLDRLAGMGMFAHFCQQVIWWLGAGPHHWSRWRLLRPQLFLIGARSVFVVGVVGAFVGMVLSVETYRQFSQWGAEAWLGGIINVSVVRKIGPVLAAVMIAGRVGGAVSAELGTMRVTEQLDAMRVMGTDPVAYLVVPRVLACLIMTPVLTIISDLLGMAGGYLVTVHGFGVNGTAYWEYARSYVQMYDVFSGLIKSVAFGLAIGLIACFKGFYCRAGAAGVGRAATDAFVTSFIAIMMLNFFFASLLRQVGRMFMID